MPRHLAAAAAAAAAARIDGAVGEGHDGPSELQAVGQPVGAHLHRTAQLQRYGQRRVAGPPLAALAGLWVWVRVEELVAAHARSEPASLRSEEQPPEATKLRPHQQRIARRLRTAAALQPLL